MLTLATHAAWSLPPGVLGPADVALLGVAMLFGIVIRLPLHVLSIMRFVGGMPAGDMSGVLAKISGLKGRRWISYDYPDSVRPGFFAYPVLFHWLVSRFPQRHWRLASVLLNIAPDLIVATAVYVLLLGRLADRPDGRHLAFLACLLTLTLPMYLNTRGRMKATNGRSLGMLLVIGYLVAMGLLLAPGAWGWAWAAAAVVLGLGAILASQFAVQAMLFMTPLLALVLLDWRPVAVLGALLAIALTVRPLGAWHVLTFKLNHFLWYRRNKHSVSRSTQNRGLLTGVLALPRRLLREPGRAKRTLLDDAALLVLLYTMTPIWLLGWALLGADAWSAALADPVMRYCLACGAASGVVFVLTSLPAFAELGHSERYFQYTVPMLVVTAVALGIEQERFGASAMLATLVVQLTILVLMHVNGSLPVWRYVRQFPSLAAEREVADWLLARGGAPRVALIPQQLQRLWPVLTRHRPEADVRYLSLWVLGPGESTEGFRWLDEIFRTHPQVPDVDPEWLRARYGIEYVVALCGYADSPSNARLPFLAALHERCPVEFANAKYRVHRIPAVSGAAAESAAPRTPAATSESGPDSGAAS